MDKLYPCPQCGLDSPVSLLVTTIDGAIIRCRKCQCLETAPAFARKLPAAFRNTDPKFIDRYPDVQDWQFGQGGLLLSGPTGTGKSRSMWDLIKRLMCQEGLRVETFDCVSFGHELSRRYRCEDAEDWLDYLGHRADLVFFDDLGKLKLTDRAEAELFGVIDRRCSHLLPVLATTNDTGETLANRMTEGRAEPLVRRLREFCRIINF